MLKKLGNTKSPPYFKILMSAEIKLRGRQVNPYILWDFRVKTVYPKMELENDPPVDICSVFRQSKLLRSAFLPHFEPNFLHDPGAKSGISKKR